MGYSNCWSIVVVLIGIHFFVSSYVTKTELDAVDAHPCMGFTGENCTYKESNLLIIIHKVFEVQECIRLCAVTYHGDCTYYIYDDFGHHDSCTLLKGPFDPFDNFCYKLNGPVAPPLHTCRESTDPCKVSFPYY